MKSLYIHIPFCVHKCFYCDFYSIERLNEIESFLVALKKEIDLFFEKHPERNSTEIETIFFGGGTPSLLKASQLGSIFDHLNKYFNITGGAEISLEANPGTMSSEKLLSYKSIGINRLSFGVQSFVDEELKFLQRIHSAKAAYNSILKAKESGFDNISLDLIFALPEQTMQSWEYTLGRAISLDVPHISAYSLIYEEGTPLYGDYQKGRVRRLENDLEADMLMKTIDELERAGYEHYEISNYAKNGLKCRHNLAYWQGREYFAFGPSAHGFLSGRRYWNVSSLRKYFGKIDEKELPIKGMEEINSEEKLTEKIYLNLRMGRLNYNEIIESFTDFNFSETSKLLKKLGDNGYLTVVSDEILLTKKGLMSCDQISVQVLNSIH
jgi:oxygen-independent coproporphyrinogen-3 oxidase